MSIKIKGSIEKVFTVVMDITADRLFLFKIGKLAWNPILMTYKPKDVDVVEFRITSEDTSKIETYKHLFLGLCILDTWEDKPLQRKQ